MDRQRLGIALHVAADSAPESGADSLRHRHRYDCTSIRTALDTPAIRFSLARSRIRSVSSPCLRLSKTNSFPWKLHDFARTRAERLNGISIVAKRKMSFKSVARVGSSCRTAERERFPELSSPSLAAVSLIMAV